METLTAKAVTMEELVPLIREQLSRGQSVRLSPRGTSMLPLLREGRDSVVLSSLPETLRKYDIVLFQRDNGAYVLHRIIRTGEAFGCIGDNQYELEYPVCRDQMIAVVTHIYREQTKHPVSEPGYRLYCRLWHGSRFARRCLRWLRNRLGR